MRYLLTAVTAASVLAGISVAQTANDTTREFTKFCSDYVRNNNGPETAATLGCSCGTGTVGAVMSPAEYILLGRLSPGLRRPETVQSLANQLKAEGVTEGQIQAIGMKLREAVPITDRVCAYLEANGLGPSGTEVSMTNLQSDQHFEPLLPGPYAAASAALFGILPEEGKE